MGVLPFFGEADLLETDGTLLGKIQVQVWPAYGRVTDVAQSYDHEAQTSLKNWDAVRIPNRIIVRKGQRFRIVQAVPAEFMGHIALRLRHMNSGGGA